MSAVLDLTTGQRRELFTQAGVELGLPAFYVEKDFWVCWVLEVLFHSVQIGRHLSFRGGTSLSKGWGLIDRFSEDIDLGISRDWVDAELPDPSDLSISRAQQDRILKRLRRTCRAVVREQIFPLVQNQVEQLGGGASARMVAIDQARDPFIIEVEYPRADLRPGRAYQRPLVKVELSGRADSWPEDSRLITPYVAQAFPRFAQRHELRISCVTPARTFWEKASLLHERHAQASTVVASRQSRHLYDLVKLWEHVQDDADLLDLFQGVKLHRKAFYSYGGIDYDQLTPGGLVLVPPEEQLQAWRVDYQDMADMFIGVPPRFQALIDSVRQIERALRGG
ncbi:MAG: nucleotidyl transferase AbiEii/AbiGii toxin family protein [Gammaproteobacteria bacterium]|nr:nucleotidyl transferase AbiEii/AbiGii toxin family protein [Gammaproteobacteria bacterium]